MPSCLHIYVWASCAVAVRGPSQHQSTRVHLMRCMHSSGNVLRLSSPRHEHFFWCACESQTPVTHLDHDSFFLAHTRLPTPGWCSASTWHMVTWWALPTHVCSKSCAHRTFSRPVPNKEQAPFQWPGTPVPETLSNDLARLCLRPYPMTWHACAWDPFQWRGTPVPETLSNDAARLCLRPFPMTPVPETLSNDLARLCLRAKS